MRNLKKILALVLALVMSLSLMAVASADDELNLGDVSDVYAESVDVLTGLKVFMGNKGEFLPKDNITRAEVAAIIYRIVTGDVTNSQNGIYADYNKFSDVTSDAWYAGYVNYCANAEYVKGVGYDANGKAMFKPQQNVTGYEALAMILRAIGYDRNNEFTGPSWQIQTAATARNRGILVNIQEGTLGTAATREAVAEILCKTILVPVADYSLAFGYRTTDANGKDNETLAYKTFKMEKIDGVVVANEQASLEAVTPLAATQTKLNLTDGTSYTLNVASTLDDIGESRYVYVIPQTGSTRFDLVCSKVYDTGKNNVYDSGEPVATVGNNTASEQGITSLTGAQHFINYDQADQYDAKIRIEYVIRLRISEYDAMVLYNTNGTADNSALYELNGSGQYVKPGDKANDTLTRDANGKIARPSSIANNTWTTTITSNGYTMGGVNYDHTYEYHKVITAFTPLTQTDYEYIRTIFSRADRIDNTVGNYILGEVYVGTTSIGTAFVTIDSSGNLVLSNTTRDVSDTMKWEDFVAQYLDIKENKAQITKNERGNRLKIVDNDNNGVADYILQTIYTVGIINANGGLDIAGVKMPDGDDVNEVTASTKVINDGEGELATGNVVIYAKIDGNARAQLAATETAKINTVNRAAKTATAVDSTEAWNESWVHTHSPNLQSYVSNLVSNTTYTLYFDLYGNLAAFTEGDNGQFVLITDGWYNNTIAGGEYAVQTWVDGHLQTTNVTENGSLFVNTNTNSGNRWGMLKTTFGNGSNINYANGTNDQVHTIVANLENGVLTPVDKIYRYSTRYDMIDMNNNVVPGRDNLTSTGTAYETTYSQQTAYQTTVANNVEVRALTTTTYYYVYRAIGSSATSDNNVVVRTYTGYNNIPSINRTYIEDVYVVGERAQGVSTNYYTANVVVVELNDKYTGYMNDSEQVFIPDFSEVSAVETIENVRMIRGNGTEETVKVDMRLSNLDWYDTAGAMGTRTRVPGLFYMDLVDGSNDTYVIQRMYPSDIRANNYLAGYVEKSSNTVGDNYVQVQMMVRPDQNATADIGVDDYVSSFAASSIGAAKAAARIPVAASVTSDIQNWQSKSVVNDNLYTLSYSSNVATLTKADKAVVLAQSRGDAINNTIADSRNERWQPGADLGNYFTNINRNEVLVRYDASGNVIWAVSFNEGTDSSINYAQTVWYNCLPSQTYDVHSFVEFYGVTDNSASDRDGAAAANNVITVDYKDATGAIIDLNGIAATISSYTLSKGDAANVAANAATNVTSTSWTRMSDAQIDAEVRNPNGAEYRLDVTTNTGNTETYYLIQRAASATDTLVPGNATTKSVYWTSGNLYLPDAAGAPGTVKQLDLDKYIETFAVSDYRSSIKFEFWRKTMPVSTLGATPDFTVEGVVTKDDGALTGSVTAKASDLPARVTTEEIAAVRITVTGENNVNNTPYSFVRTGYSGSSPITKYTVTYSAANDAYKLNGGTSNVDVVAGGTVTLAGNNTTDIGTFYAGATAIGRVEGNGEIVTYTPTANVTITFRQDMTVGSVLTNAGLNPAAGAGAKLAAASTVDPATGVLTLTNDVDLDTDALNLTSGKELEIDLAGHTLAIGASVTVESADLTIKNTGAAGSGKIVTNSMMAAIGVKGTGSQVTLDGVSIEGANGNYTGTGVSLLNSTLATGAADVTIKNSTIKAQYGINVNGTNVNSNKITIENSNIDGNTGGAGIGMYLAGKAAVRVTESTIAGGSTGVEIRNGSLTMVGGSISTTNMTFEDKCGQAVSGGGVSVYGAALSVSTHSTTDADMIVNLNGVSLTAPRHVTLCNKAVNAVATKNATINLTNCTFSDGTMRTYTNWDSANATGTISDGVNTIVGAPAGE